MKAAPWLCGGVEALGAKWMWKPMIDLPGTLVMRFM